MAKCIRFLPYLSIKLTSTGLLRLIFSSLLRSKNLFSLPMSCFSNWKNKAESCYLFLWFTFAPFCKKSSAFWISEFVNSFKNEVSLFLSNSSIFIPMSISFWKNNYLVNFKLGIGNYCEIWLKTGVFPWMSLRLGSIPQDITSFNSCS